MFIAELRQLGGATWRRLSAVMSEVDPGNVFLANHAIRGDS